MARRHSIPGLSALLVVLCRASDATAGELAVVSVSPALNGLNAPVTTNVSVTFDRPIDPLSVNSASFRVFGRWSGTAEGAFSFSNKDHTVTLTPINRFSAGENVMVNLSHDLVAADGSPLRGAGYSWRFWTRTRHACWSLQQIDQFSNRTTPSVNTRIYGALGSDLDNDGWLDITTVNEDSNDLRIFMNRTDGTGLYHPFIQPPSAGLHEMSPNEPADFNNDGFTDVCVCSSATNNVRVFLGLGNGAFQPPQVIAVGTSPLGICVLDIEGDGDLDIVNGNYSSSNLSIMLNNGSGVFGAPAYFESGGAGEYGLASGDMNNDGILDLVVGARSSSRVIVMLGNGAGGFSGGGFVNGVGSTWQIGTGDVNGDGFEDVNVSNSSSNTGAIILGNGAGGLGTPAIHPVPSQAVATDLADLDGDGDLDWTISSFGGGRWTLFRNNGAGVFTQQLQFVAVSNPACSTSMDLNNDGRIDVVLLDEIADLVTLRKNVVQAGDTNCDLAVDVDDLINVILHWGPCGAAMPCAADIAPVAGNDTVDVDDLIAVILNWG